MIGFQFNNNCYIKKKRCVGTLVGFNDLYETLDLAVQAAGIQ